MSDNEIKCIRSYDVKEYRTAEMEAKESRLALSDLIGWNYGYETVLSSAVDVYEYKGKVIADGEFHGFIDPEQTIVEMGSKVYKNGREILDKSRFGVSYRGGKLFKPDDSKLFFADNTIVRMTNGVAVFYDDNGKEVAEIDADQFLGVDRKSKQSAFLVNGEVFVYDHSQLPNVEKVKVNESRLQEFTIFERTLVNPTENDLPARLGKDTVYDDNNKSYTISSLYSFRDSDYYEFHDMHFTMPDIKFNFSEIGKNSFFENKTKVLLDDSGVGLVYKVTPRPLYLEYLQNKILLCNDEIIEPYIKKNAELLGIKVEQEKKDDIFNISFTLNLSFASLGDERKMEQVEKQLNSNPELVQELSSQIIAKYILMHPEKKEFGKYINADNISDVVVMQLYDIGINVLQPHEFMRAMTGEQKLKACARDFDIGSIDDFKNAFKQLAYGLRDENPINVEIAELLLTKLVKNYSDVFLGGEQSKTVSDMISYEESYYSKTCKQDDIINAVAMLKTKDIEFIKLWAPIESKEITERLNPRYLKGLVKLGIIKVDAKEYMHRNIDELCPVDEIFIDPHDSRVKTNLLDLGLRAETPKKIVSLLNHGANVMVNVERYSRKQDKVFPIKPYARFFDNKIFLNKMRDLRKMMEAIASGLDVSKEHVIDQIFESLPRKTNENEYVKQLKTDMHRIFEQTHKNVSEELQTKELTLKEQFDASHQFYLDHKKEFAKLDERIRLAGGESKEAYEYKYADEYGVKNHYDQYIFYSADFLEKQKEKVANLERTSMQLNVEKYFNRFLQLSVGDSSQTIQERADAVHLRFLVKRDPYHNILQIEIIDKKERDGTATPYISPIAIDDNVLLNINNLLLDREEKYGIVSSATRKETIDSDKGTKPVSPQTLFFEQLKRKHCK